MLLNHKISYFNIKSLSVKVSLLFLIYLFICISINSCQKPIVFSTNGSPYFPQQMKFKKKNLALVLGGGGAKGFAHIGVLEELEKVGIIPDLIIGCSAGSIIGGLYAADPVASHLKDILKSKRNEVISFTFKNWPHSIYSINQLKKYLQEKLKIHTFERLKIPFIATATNLQYGNITYFSKGDLINPIAASAAYPGAFAPVKIENQFFIDGGVANPVPVYLAKKLGFKTVIAVNIAAKLPNTSATNMLGIVKRSSEIAYINQIQFAIQEADLVIDFDFQALDMFTDQYNYYLYEEGKKSTQKAMPNILKLLKKNDRSTNNNS